MPLDLSEEYDFDSDKENEGVWEDIGGGARVLVASSDCPKYREAFTNLSRNIRRKIDRNKLSEEEDAEIMSRIVGKTILLDWEGIYDDGEEIPYSTQNAISLLKKYPKFRRDVSALAADENRYRIEDTEQAAKNSSVSLDGHLETEED